MFSYPTMSQSTFETNNAVETGSQLPQIEQINQHISQQIDQMSLQVKDQDPQRAKFLTDLKPVLSRMIDSYSSNPNALFQKEADQQSIFESVIGSQPTQFL